MATSIENCDFELGKKRKCWVSPIEATTQPLLFILETLTIQLSCYVSKASDHYENQSMSLDFLLPLVLLVRFLEVNPTSHFAPFTDLW